MKDRLRFPVDYVTGKRIDYNSVSDYLELSAFLSGKCSALVTDIENYGILTADGMNDDYNEETLIGMTDVVSGTIARLNQRARFLESSYPFVLDCRGNKLIYRPDPDYLGKTAYIVSLILSNLKDLSPVMRGSELHPGETEVRNIRNFFQYFATAALAAELHGHAWSFGFPRPDSSGFIKKLNEIWEVLGDGAVNPQLGSPQYPKDDGVDVFAACTHNDRLPGYLLAVAQVATGKNTAGKHLKGRLPIFSGRWFSTQPVTIFIPYMIVPFVKERDEFIDLVRSAGNVLHRLRLPRRVDESGMLVRDNKIVEGYDRLVEAREWVKNYRDGILS